MVIFILNSQSFYLQSILYNIINYIKKILLVVVVLVLVLLLLST